MMLHHRRLFSVFAAVYAVHVAYGVFFLARFEQVEAWTCPLVFLVGLNAAGFLVWVSAHRWLALGNVFIHLVGTLGEAKNVFLGGGLWKVPVVVTHGIMLLVFLWLYLRAR